MQVEVRDGVRFVDQVHGVPWYIGSFDGRGLPMVVKTSAMVDLDIEELGRRVATELYWQGAE